MAQFRLASATATKHQALQTTMSKALLKPPPIKPRLFRLAGATTSGISCRGLTSLRTYRGSNNSWDLHSLLSGLDRGETREGGRMSLEKTLNSPPKGIAFFQA